MQRSFLALLGLTLLLPTARATGTPVNPQLSAGITKAIAAAVTKELEKYGGTRPVPGAAVGSGCRVRASSSGASD